MDARHNTTLNNEVGDAAGGLAPNPNVAILTGQKTSAQKKGILYCAGHNNSGFMLLLSTASRRRIIALSKATCKWPAAFRYELKENLSLG